MEVLADADEAVLYEAGSPCDVNWAVNVAAASGGIVDAPNADEEDDGVSVNSDGEDDGGGLLSETLARELSSSLDTWLGLGSSRG